MYPVRSIKKKFSVDDEKVCMRLFLMVSPIEMAQNEEFKDKQLQLIDGKYFVVTASKPKKLAKGWYDFVIPADNMKIIFCRHSVEYLALVKPEKAGAKRGFRGHSALTPVRDADRPVFFAGELYFEKEGVLKLWTDKSGHYLCTSERSDSKRKKSLAFHQTKHAVDGGNNPLLSAELFQASDGI